jgi:hypothetical protein
MIADRRVLRCDAPGCPAALGWPARTWPSPTDLRRWAHEHHGWTRDGRGGDRCPSHGVPGGAVAPPPAAG